MRTLLRTFTFLALAAVAALGFGFIWFTHEIARVEPEDVRAEGIVALTGGANRVSDAVSLLAQGRAQRLLVTGVNRSTTRQDLARVLGGEGRLVECCVDLDYNALNTVGNAVETRRWVARNGFRSVIVVTSSYHMPRTLAELRRLMPQTTLIPYPVTSEHVQLDDWWKHPTTVRLLAAEYAKLVVALARFLVMPDRRAHAEGSTG
jgi:uncharacterized SAM-binding protein YcdF (DUF218 family)